MRFDYKQPVLMVMIKRDLTHRCPSLGASGSHLARLCVDGFGGNEEAISESVITASVSATAEASNAFNSAN